MEVVLEAVLARMKSIWNNAVSILLFVEVVLEDGRNEQPLFAGGVVSILLFVEVVLEAGKYIGSNLNRLSFNPTFRGSRSGSLHRGAERCGYSCVSILLFVEVVLEDPHGFPAG